MECSFYSGNGVGEKIGSRVGGEVETGSGVAGAALGASNRYVLDATEAARQRLLDEDVLGQLLERRGRMAELATEAGDVKLDWADQLAWVLDHPERLAETVLLAERLREGASHLVWSGMGGSVQAVRCLAELGWLEAPATGNPASDNPATDRARHAPAAVRIHPLDSTDPRALSRLVGALGGEAGLAATSLVAVSMGMTSEEPIAHLRWLGPLLERATPGRSRARQVVMSIPGSYLYQHAEAMGITTVPLQLDGANHVAGRMSAPGTRVFLLPAALALGSIEKLTEVLRRSQDAFALRPDMPAEERYGLVQTDPFIGLACWLAGQIAAGRDMVLLETDDLGRGLAPWVEQVVEESLCKDGRGLLTFYDQNLPAGADSSRLLRLRMHSRGADPPGAIADPEVPTATVELFAEADLVDRLALAARFFAGWNLAVALVGYLRDLVFAGQPGVEGYKRYARELRDSKEPLPFPSTDMSVEGGVRLWYGALPTAGPPAPGEGRPGKVLAEALQACAARAGLAYFDLTVNGEPAGPAWDRLAAAARSLANQSLGIPCKLRTGPADYHSTEQSQVDGPPELCSLRVAIRNLPAVGTGDYDDRFFHAQALGTVLAMRDAGRPVLLALLNTDADGEALVGVLEEASSLLGASTTPVVTTASSGSRTAAGTDTARRIAQGRAR